MLSTSLYDAAAMASRKQVAHPQISHAPPPSPPKFRMHLRPQTRAPLHVRASSNDSSSTGSTGTTSSTQTVSPTQSQQALLKAQLRQTISSLNLATAPPDTRVLSSTLLELIEALSALSPIRDTASSPLIDGRWVLLYTASGSPGSSSSSKASPASAPSAEAGLASSLPFLQAISDSLYQVFYRYLPVLAGSAVGKASSVGPFKARGNYQVFDTRGSRVLNEAMFTAWGQACCISVGGSVEVVPPAPGGRCTRVKATFTEGRFVIGDGIAQTIVPIPLGWLSPVGYVDTPYLDEELRISRGDKGSIFIAMRC